MAYTGNTAPSPTGPNNRTVGGNTSPLQEPMAPGSTPGFGPEARSKVWTIAYDEQNLVHSTGQYGSDVDSVPAYSGGNSPAGPYPPLEWVRHVKDQTASDRIEFTSNKAGGKDIS